MRKGAGYLAIVFSVALLVLATAGASPAWADPNNGTVKIHEGNTENEPIRANDPHVQCSFHIHGFNFDGGAGGTWRIEGWSPTGGGTYNGTWGPANAQGDWRTAVMTIPPGHYKLFVWQTTPNDPPGGAKHKVFWVECGPTTGGSGPTGSTGATGPTGSTGGSGSSGNSGNAGGNANSGGNAAAGGNVNSGGSAVAGGNAPGASTVTGGTAATTGVVAGVQSAPQGPQAVAGVQNLPATSTDPTRTPLLALGLVILVIGVVLLRRPAMSATP